ncbi:MAG TPA: OsmC family protein [Rhodanobacteraceae bacterium]|nr:OsmC family protein [Rhodanobacteraceae bacterium]
MSDSETILLTITQESDYEFRVRFDDTALGELAADESPPIGRGAGPDPTRLLAAAVGNCLSASLLFALRKFKNQPGRIVTRVRAEHVRNAQKRLRVGRIAVEIALPESAAEYAQLDRILAQFEDFCTVTESVRAGVPVEVSVRDASGAIVHTSEHAP